LFKEARTALAAVWGRPGFFFFMLLFSFFFLGLVFLISFIGGGGFPTYIKIERLLKTKSIRD
jgi:hypothetical protein